MKSISKTISRRSFVGATAAAAIFAPQILRAAAPVKIRYASLSTGFSVIIDEFMAANRFDLKHDLDMSSVNSYVSVGSYLNDFAAGTFDLAIAGWDSAAELHHRGVPVQFVSTLVTADMINLLGAKDSPQSIPELKGKSIAAVIASGTYQLSKVLVRALYGLELEKDITVQNVPNPAQVITMLMAGNAPAGLAWEPNVSIGMSRDPSIKPIFNFGDGYRKKTGKDLPYFGIAVQKSVLTGGSDIGARIAASMSDCIAAIRANPHQALDLAAKRLKVEPSVLYSAYDSGRLRFIGGSMNKPSDRKLVEDAALFFQKHGATWATLQKDFFIS